LLTARGGFDGIGAAAGFSVGETSPLFGAVFAFDRGLSVVRFMFAL